MRREIQECGNDQPCIGFIQNIFAMQLFPNKDIKEEYFALHYKTDLPFKRTSQLYKFMKKFQIMKGEDKNNQKSLVTTLLESVLINQILMNMKNLVGYKSTSKTQLENQ